jgi:hypothetical protein
MGFYLLLTVQKFGDNHHIKSFCSKNLWRSITSRVFIPNIFGGASNREFWAQNTLEEHHIKSFCPKYLWRSITSRVFVPKYFGGALHQEFLAKKSLNSHLFAD